LVSPEPLGMLSATTEVVLSDRVTNFALLGIRDSFSIFTGGYV
jgi:hypothetical protein